MQGEVSPFAARLSTDYKANPTHQSQGEWGFAVFDCYKGYKKEQRRGVAPQQSSCAAAYTASSAVWTRFAVSRAGLLPVISQLSKAVV